jgi:hypothetical protein
VRIFLAITFCILLTGTPAVAQDNSPKPADNTGQTSQNPSTPAGGDTPSAGASGAGASSQSQATASQKLPDTPSKTKVDQEKEIEKAEQSYRVMGVVPRFGTTHIDATPLTKAEKFHLFWKSASDPATLVLLGGQAGIGQGLDSHPGYGLGAQGYAKRYGAALADSTTSGFFSNFFYPVIFKQDPRYFRLGEGKLTSRLEHSLVEQVVAHQDHGGRMFHFSNVLGALTSGGISNAYYPKADRGFGLTMQGTGIALLYGELGGLFDEFWPDVQNRILKRKQYPTMKGEKLPEISPPVSAPMK